MRPQRLSEGIKRARRILRIRRMTWKWIQERWPEWLADGGKDEHYLRFTRCPCSCAGCGNPRRHFGEITLQERKANEEMECQLRDFEFPYWDDDAWADYWTDYAQRAIENMTGYTQLAAVAQSGGAPG